MELYKEILTNALRQEGITVSFPGLKIDAEKIVAMECYKALCQIKEIIHDDRLEDSACFDRIEEVINALETIGSDGGFRHDFG